MAKSRSVVEKQLKLAQKALEDCVSKLGEQAKGSGKTLEHHPRWRQLNAKVKHLGRQLRSVERRESFAPTTKS
ncbi:MAG: hypothetical protein ACOH5I_18960 [Oligoflexus sp.]